MTSICAVGDTRSFLGIRAIIMSDLKHPALGAIGWRENVGEKKMDNTGIDPVTYRMQSDRSTI
mgnify:FL=1